MLRLLGLVLLGSALTSAVLPDKCATVRCGLPTECEKEYFYIPEGECCQICKDKPGVCPASGIDVGGICLHECSEDHECDGILKCCRNGCGNTCQMPLADCSAAACLAPECKDAEVPKGECCPVCTPDKCFAVTTCEVPKCKDYYVPKGRCCPVCPIDKCATVLCALLKCDKKDSYTPKGECCPICKDKPGVCPAPGIDVGGICLHDCSEDHDCDGKLKCCRNGCGNTCQTPVDCSTVRCAKPVCDESGSYTPEWECCERCKNKPGTCPETDGNFGICVEECSKDQDCKYDEKCCSNGCGHTCQLPDCTNGQNGICGTIAGRACTIDTSCMFIEQDISDGAGKCCINKPKPISACKAPLKVGPCRAAVNRYFYNTATCKCEKFSWGGCDPNENNFLDLNHCRSSCEKPKKPNPVCQLPTEPGTCKAKFTRWSYNKASCKCEEFTYGGCGGNDNNFLSESLCKEKCGCHDCDVCKLPILPDGDGEVQCKAYIPSYGYNAKTCRCEKFIYSGCGGNKNRFATLEECVARCNDTDCEQQICALQKDPGPCTCTHFCKRFYFDPLSCKCKKFEYGGCEGNSNRFKSRRKCEESCGNTACSVCEPPPSKGPCEAKREMWYFDVYNRKCKTFEYGGCEGNMNRFQTKDDCMGACGSYRPVCLEPVKVGPCNLKPDKKRKRFYYDGKKKKCRKFYWGGCLPNGNNFESKKLCKQACKRFF